MNDIEPADVLCATDANVQYFSIPVCYSGTYRISEGGTIHEQRTSLKVRRISYLSRITNGRNTVFCDVQPWDLTNTADINQTTRRRNSEGRSVSTDGTASDITYRLMLLLRYVSVFLQSNN